MSTPRQEHLKKGILTYLANYTFTVDDEVPFCDSRSSSLQQIKSFLQRQRVDPGELDRTKRPSDERERRINPFHAKKKVPNPYYCVQRSLIHQAIDDMLEEGFLVRAPGRNGHGELHITQAGAAHIGDTLLAETFDSKISQGAIKKMAINGTLPSMAPVSEITVDENAPDLHHKTDALEFATVASVVSDVLGDKAASTKAILQQLRVAGSKDLPLH